MTANAIAIPYADLCAIHAHPGDIDFFLHSAGLSAETATAEEYEWAVNEALEAAIRDEFVRRDLIDFWNVVPMKSGKN